MLQKGFWLRLRVRLHIAINRAVFVSSWMLYIYTKVTKCIREKIPLYFCGWTIKSHSSGYEIGPINRSVQTQLNCTRYMKIDILWFTLFCYSPLMKLKGFLDDKVVDPILILVNYNYEIIKVRKAFSVSQYLISFSRYLGFWYM